MLKSVSSITNAIGALNYKGTWNASTNTPTLADGTGAKGDYYVVSVAGTQTFGGILLDFGVGDWIVYNGAVWQRVEGGADGNFVNLSVSSVATFAAGAVATPSITTTGDLNTGIWFPAADTFAISTAGTERMRIGSTGIISLGATAGAESLRVTPGASAVNYLNVNGASTGNGPYIIAAGSDTSIAAYLISKGSNPTYLATGGGIVQFAAAHTASAVNFLAAFGNSTGNGPYLQANGSDTNISLLLSAKGTGGLDFYTAGNSFTRQFQVAHTASAVNYHQITGSATGSAVVHSAQGSDTNIDLALTPKGTGVLSFGTYTAGILAQAGYITIKDAAGNTRNLLVG